MEVDGSEDGGYRGRTAHLSDEPLRQFYIDHGLLANAYVAIDLAHRAGILIDLVHCFRRSLSKADEELCTGLLSGSDGLSEVLAELARNEGLLEEACCRFVRKAAPILGVSDCQFDGHLLADLTWRLVSGAWPNWPAKVVCYAVNWKVKTFYDVSGRLLVVPFLLLFRDDLPNAQQLSRLYESIDKVRSANRPIPVRKLAHTFGFDECESNLNFLRFIAANDPDVFMYREAGEDFIELADGAIPRMDLLSFHAVFELVKIEGLGFRRGWRQRITIHVSPLAEGFFKRSGCWPLPHRIAIEEVMVKAWMRRQRVERKVQGIGRSLHSAIKETLQERQHVVTIGEVGAHIGVRNLKLDPYSVHPGEILVFGPSEKFLHSDKTSFVLRDWVQTSQQKRGKIHPDRLLTPQEVVDISVTEADIKSAVMLMESYKLLGIVFLSDLLVPFERRAQKLEWRWVKHHVTRRISGIMSGLGFVEVLGGLFFCRSTWPDLNFRSAPEVKEALSETVMSTPPLPEWLASRVRGIV